MNLPMTDDRMANSAQRPASRWWLVLLAVTMVGSVWWLQRPEDEDPQDAANANLGLHVSAPKSDPMIMVGKLVLAFKDGGGMIAPLLRGQIDGAVGNTLDDSSAPPADQLRAAMLLLGEGYPDKPEKPEGFAMMGAPTPPSISERLKWVETHADPASPLQADAAVVRSLLEAAEVEPDAAGGEGKPGVSMGQPSREARMASSISKLSAEQVGGLKDRHGWFAEVLLSSGDEQAAVRTDAKRQAVRFGFGAVLVGGFMVLALVAGCGLLVTGLILRLNGKLGAKFQRPPPYGHEQPVWAEHVWLETFCIFVGGFLTIKLVVLALEHQQISGAAIGWVALSGNWVLTSAIFWPVVRGLNWKLWRERIGWRTNRPGPVGVATEIGVGIMGYCCALVVMAATLIGLFIARMVIDGGGSMPTKQINKIGELVGSGNIWLTITIFLLAVIWAPIVEESVFRGALFRHLRRNFPVVVAAMVSAGAFALMHSYATLQLVMVGSLGLTFAIFREWRGSLIPSATAHFIQNAIALSVALAMGPLMKP